MKEHVFIFQAKQKNIKNIETKLIRPRHLINVQTWIYISSLQKKLVNLVNLLSTNILAFLAKYLSNSYLKSDRTGRCVSTPAPVHNPQWPFACTVPRSGRMYGLQMCPGWPGISMTLCPDGQGSPWHCAMLMTLTLVTSVVHEANLSSHICVSNG